MYSKFELKNTSQVIFVPLHDTKSITVLVMFPVGSRYETGKIAGVSHFIEHMMFKGTKRRPSTLILTREIDRLGAMYNAFTGKEYTGYYIKTDSKYIEISLDILSDMLFNSLFDETEMEKEKSVIVEEIRMYDDNPIMNIDNIFESVLYSGCPLGRDVAGSRDTVMSYKKADVLNFFDHFYQPKNMLVCLAGKIDEKTKQVVEKYFGQKANILKTATNFIPARFGNSSKTGRIKIQNKKTDQTQLMLGFPCFPYGHRLNSAVAVLNTVLGGSMSSRLFIRIREKLGLAYSIHSGQEKYRDSGFAYVKAGIEAKNINKAISEIKKEIDLILKKGITKRELKDAKTNIHGSTVLSLEDSSAQANWYAVESMFMKKIKTPDEKLKEIEHVSMEDVQEVAEKIFHFEKMRVGIIGSAQKQDIIF